MSSETRLVALVTGASSGFGRMISNDLADAGHVAYASMRGTTGKNAKVVEEIGSYARDRDVALRSVELDVQSERSIEDAVKQIIAQCGRLDVIVHNAGHMVYGASEAFTLDQLAELYDINVLGTQRVNRVVLPVMRAAKSGLVVWISSTSVAGGVPPFLGPYFAAKAAMDALAVCYGKEIAPLGIETSIVVPGAFTTGTNHFKNAGRPKDTARAQEYEAAYPSGFLDEVEAALAKTVPEDADPGGVGRAVVEIVAAPPGKRPYRLYVDPASDGASVVFPVMDRIREQFLSRIGFRTCYTSVPRLRHPNCKALLAARSKEYAPGKPNGEFIVEASRLSFRNLFRACKRCKPSTRAARLPMR